MSDQPPHHIASLTRSEKLAANSAALLSTQKLLHQTNDTFKLSKKTKLMPQVLANAVLDAETGNMLEYSHLMQHSNPNIQKIWTT